MTTVLSPFFGWFINKFGERWCFVVCGGLFVLASSLVIASGYEKDHVLG